MTTLFVNSGQSIQTAINSASAGDTIVVFAGIYNESININKAVSVVSFDGAASTIIHGQVTNPNFSFSVNMSAAGATFGDTGHGFTVNAGAQETAGVFVGANNEHIEGNIINGNATAAANFLHQGLLTG